MKFAALISFFISTIHAYGVEILAYPYLQPGNASGLNYEEKVILWQTDDAPATFRVSVWEAESKETVNVPIEVKLLQHEKRTRLYRARLFNLKFDTQYYYTVFLENTPIRDQVFKTRTKKNTFSFAVVGCTGENTEPQKNIATLIEKEKPEFVLHLGDFIYPYAARMSHFFTNAWPQYNAPSKPTKEATHPGSDFMSRYPTYLTFGNHDLTDGAGVTAHGDGLPAAYYFDLPSNGPSIDISKLLHGSPTHLAQFQSHISSKKLQTMTNYSFDVGNVHFVVLDGNTWANPKEILGWLTEDLKQAHQKENIDWIFASIHQPPFHAMIDTSESLLNGAAGSLMSSGQQNTIHATIADRNRARKFVETLQNGGVDLVFNAHIHDYERTQEIIYHSAEKRITSIKLDDFESKLKLGKGIIYINSASGGAHLHLENLKGQSGKLFAGVVSNMFRSGIAQCLKSYLAQYDLDHYSFSKINIDGKKLSFQQIDETGRVMDTMTLAKKATFSFSKNNVQKNEGPVNPSKAVHEAVLIDPFWAITSFTEKIPEKLNIEGKDLEVDIEKTLQYNKIEESKTAGLCLIKLKTLAQKDGIILNSIKRDSLPSKASIITKEIWLQDRSNRQIMPFRATQPMLGSLGYTKNAADELKLIGVFDNTAQGSLEFTPMSQSQNDQITNLIILEALKE